MVHRAELGLREILQGRRGAPRRRAVVLHSERRKGSHAPLVRQPPGAGHGAEEFLGAGDGEKTGEQGKASGNAEIRRKENFPRGEGSHQGRRLAGGEDPGLQAPRLRRKQGNGNVLACLCYGRQPPSRPSVLGNEGPRSDDADHLPVHQRLSVRLPDLLADGHLAPRPDEPPEVGVHRVPRHPRHGDALRRVPGGQGNVQDLRGLPGVVEEHLVKITHAEEEDAVGVEGFPFGVLGEHGGHLHPRGELGHETPPHRRSSQLWRMRAAATLSTFPLRFLRDTSPSRRACWAITVENRSSWSTTFTAS